MQRRKNFVRIAFVGLIVVCLWNCNSTNQSTKNKVNTLSNAWSSTGASITTLHENLQKAIAVCNESVPAIQRQLNLSRKTSGNEAVDSVFYEYKHSCEIIAELFTSCDTYKKSYTETRTSYNTFENNVLHGHLSDQEAEKYLQKFQALHLDLDSSVKKLQETFRQTTQLHNASGARLMDELDMFASYKIEPR